MSDAPVVRICGNSQFINGAANVISLANTYLAAANAGSTMLYVYNSNNSVQTIFLSNSQGVFTFDIAGNSVILLSKNATDLVASANAANGYIYANPIARSPS